VVNEEEEIMVSLEEVLLSLKAKDSVVLLGETYKIKNIISATDGSILKARLLLVKPEDSSLCITIEVSTQVHNNIKV
jgi:hypothetical protein